jgi:hypothetical protein
LRGRLLEEIRYFFKITLLIPFTKTFNFRHIKFKLKYFWFAFEFKELSFVNQLINEPLKDIPWTAILLNAA